MTPGVSTRGIVNVLAVGSPDLRAALANDGSLADDIERHTGGTFGAEISIWPAPDHDDLAATLEARSDELDSIDVAILSVNSGAPLENRSEDLALWFHAPFADAFAILKRHGVFIIVLNGSTFDPDETSSRLDNEVAPPSLMVHRLDAALIELSVADGISIVDVDRLAAQMSGAAAIESILVYTPECNAVIRAEIVRILDDSRVFAAGPTVAQVGQRQRTDAV